MNDTSLPSAVFDPKTVLRFFLALFKGAPKDAVVVLQHGETRHLLGQRAPLPLDILATAAQAGERITFSPALREARDPQAVSATPVVWVHVQTDLPAMQVLGQLYALRPAAVVRADEGVDIYWKISGLAPEDAPAAMESLAAALGGSVTPTHALRPVPLCIADAALDPNAPAVHYDAMTEAIALLPRLTPRATVVAHVSTCAAQAVASEHPSEPDAAGPDVAVSTARFEGDTARAPFDGSPASADEATGPRPFPEASALLRALAEAEELPLEQAWLLWVVRESQRQFGQRFTLAQLNVDSVLLMNGHLVVRRGHRYFGVRRAEDGTFYMEPMVQ